MLPDPAKPGPQPLVAALEEDRHRSFERTAAHRRALLETRTLRPPLLARLAAATWRVARRDRHSMTHYPCRLPDGKTGRTAVVFDGGDWTLVCRVA